MAKIRFSFLLKMILFFSIFYFLCLSVQGEEVVRVGSHRLCSSFWISLHERLRHEALLESPETHAEFDDKDRQIWKESLEIYRREVAPKDPVFNSELVEWQNKIALMSNREEPSGIPEDIAGALRRAAAIYRKKLWQEDDTANRFWIAVESTLLREAGPEITKDASKAYGVTWPALLHIEVTPFAEPFGANTPSAIDGLFLSMISSRDPGNQGFSGLELLFHEPLHHFDAVFMRLLDDVSKKMNKPVPRRLSHAILFYTAGELTRRALMKRGVVYTTVASEVAKRAWPTYMNPLEKYWQAYVDGKMSENEALQQILTALSP
jgi:hypothetical protein